MRQRDATHSGGKPLVMGKSILIRFYMSHSPQTAWFLIFVARVCERPQAPPINQYPLNHSGEATDLEWAGQKILSNQALIQSERSTE